MMKRRILYTALVAAIMGTASPVYADDDDQIMYRYFYHENGAWVGEGHDLCRPDGIIRHAEVYWGYATNDYQAVISGGCYKGWVPEEW